MCLDVAVVLGYTCIGEVAAVNEDVPFRQLRKLVKEDTRSEEKRA